MNRLALSPGQRRRLERQLQQTPSSRVYRRTLAVLEYNRGRSVADIAESLEVTRQSVYNWIEAYAQTLDHRSLEGEPGHGRASLWTSERQALLRALLESSPAQLGYFAVNWTVPLLQHYIEQATDQRLSDDTIRRELRRQDYVWKRPRYVLEPDPDRDKKTLDPAPSAPVEGGSGPDLPG